MHTNLNFSLTQLEYVLAVHKHGHFAKAAESCHITQPTLSMQIQKLEQDLDITIFDRSKKPILLTSAGQRLIEQFKLILFESKKIESILQSSAEGKLRGELIVGVIPTVAPYLLPLLLPKLEKLYPELNLNIQELQTHRIVEDLNNDLIDVGILATPLKISKIFEKNLYFEPFTVLCKKEHELGKLKSVKYSSLKFEDIWLLEEGHCLRHQVLDVCSLKQKNTAKRKFHFESGSLETLKNLVDSYGGYTLLPQLATDHIGNNTALVPFEHPIPAREIGLVFRREHYKSALIDALGESILRAIPEQLCKIRQKDLDVLPIA